MKTKTNYPERTRKATMIFAAVLFLAQSSIIANDGAECSNSYNARNAYDYLYEEAYEPEMEIEEWMYTIHNDVFNHQPDEEEEYELEEWMYNTQHSFWLDLNDEEEPEIDIESWMTNPNEWTDKSNEILFTAK